MLELQNIFKSFEDRSVLADVNLRVPKGATHALIGSSGSGKTTLLRITLGLIPFDRGYVKINDQALLSFTQVEWADRIGYVPQDGGLFPHISGRNNVVLIATVRGWSKSKIEARPLGTRDGCSSNKRPTSSPRHTMAAARSGCSNGLAGDNRTSHPSIRHSAKRFNSNSDALPSPSRA